MKLNRQQINVRLPVQLLEKMKLIQEYKARTATIIIEDALEKGLKWYLQQIGAELGYKKEDPLTWKKLADLVKLSVSPKKDDKPKEEDKPQESQEQTKEVSDYQVELELYKYYNDIDKKLYPDFQAWLIERIKTNQLTKEKAQEIWNEHVRNTQ